MSTVPNFGFTPDQTISYLNLDLSTKENMFENEMTLLNNTQLYSHLISHNYKYYTESKYQKQCGYAKESGLYAYCGATVGLCVEEYSEIFKCDAGDRVTVDSEVFNPPDNGLAEELGLVGDAFTLPIREDNNCYLSTVVLLRNDDARLIFYDIELTKRIIVADPRGDPHFRAEPPTDWYAGAGEYFEIPFDKVMAPDGVKVNLVPDFQNASRFANFDYD